jgi:L-asparaginase/Glu-tRNA(Gln) amidotransferase subunit D
MNHDVWLKLAKRVNEKLSSQKAGILLMLTLMNTNDPVKLQQVFMQY